MEARDPFMVEYEGPIAWLILNRPDRGINDWGTYAGKRGIDRNHRTGSFKTSARTFWFDDPCGSRRTGDFHRR